MKIIIPMAGMGKRLRPHTLLTPKPLIPLAGKPIVTRLCESLMGMTTEPVEEIGFVVGRFGPEVENNLVSIAGKLGSRGSIHYQDEPLGTAHAILAAGDLLEGNVLVAFADTLFVTDFRLDPEADGIIWVYKVADPKGFGVVTVDSNGVIDGFAEKPEKFVSDQAIIGIYYFRDGKNLREEMQYLVDHDIRDKGEYQLTTAMDNMRKKGRKLIPGPVTEWLDCGNKDSTVQTNKRILDIVKGQEKLVSPSARHTGSKIVEPCYLADNVEIYNSIVGPYVSVEGGTVLDNVVVKDSIILGSSHLRNCRLENSMVGNFVKYDGKIPDPRNGAAHTASLSLGDYSESL